MHFSFHTKQKHCVFISFKLTVRLFKYLPMHIWYSYLMRNKYIWFRHIFLAQPFLCNTCGRGFQSRQGLIDHMGIKHGVPKFQCAACSKGFSTKTHYTSHMQNHLNVRNSDVFHKTNFSFDLICMYHSIVKVRIYRYIFFILTKNSYKCWIINKNNK